MNSPQKCINHPLVAAIDTCASCKKPLCGMCGNYANLQAFCLSCYKDYEAETLVKQRNTQANTPKPSRLTEELDEAVFSPPTKSKVNFAAIRTGLISICILVIGWNLYRYNQPVEVIRDASVVQIERSQAALIQCLSIFTEIGQLLAAGGDSAIDLRCTDTTLNNKIQNIEGERRVTHPNPNFYGVKEIYVSATNPIPVVVPLPE